MKINITFLIATLSLASATCFAQQASPNELRQLQQFAQAAQTTQPAKASSISDRIANLRSIQARQAARQQPQNKVPEVGAVAKSPLPASAETKSVKRQQEKLPSQAEIIDEAAFRSMMQNVFPLKPEQILRLRARHEQTKRAGSSSASTPPTPTATSQIVNLSPGSTPPVIRLAQGFVSSLVFLDSTGADWPIIAYDLGNPKAFNIQWDKTSNTIMVQASELFTYGNLAVRLKGLSTPVMLTLIPGQKAVDYRVDLRIQGYGPNAKMMPIVNGLPGNTSSMLLSVLDGIPPPHSTELRVSGGDAQVWQRDETLYVRTRLNVISPGWLATMSSADGMHVYQMQKTPLLLVTLHGKIAQIKIEGL